MAKKTMTATVSSFKAQRYEGSYNASDGTVTVTGDFATDGSRQIESFSGRIDAADGTMLGTFNSYRTGEGLSYSLHDVAMDNFETVRDAVAAAQEAIVGQINQEG